MKKRLEKYLSAGVDSGVIVPPPFPKERKGKIETYLYTYAEREREWGERERGSVGNSIDLLGTKKH